MFELIIDDCKKIKDSIDFSWFKNKKILVTGASGLLGIYFVSTLKLIKDEYNIEIYVWVKSTLDGDILSFFEDCNIIQSDITDLEIFEKLPLFDCIIHSSGYGQPGRFLQNKIKTIELNSTSTINLFKILKPTGKFLFLSTSEIYNGLENENIDESLIGNTNTDHPRACYIEGKRIGETICYAHKEIGIDVKIGRLSLAYGPGTKISDQRVLNSLIEKGLTKDEIKLLDSGSAIRTYCYISDAVEMFWNILLYGKDTLYNIGGTSKVSILELSKLIGKKLSKPVILPENVSPLEGSPKVVNMSIEKYLKEFNKKKFVGIDEGLEKTIKWQKNLYNV